MAVSLYRVLIDTCIWLELARNYRAAPLVRALHEMCNNAQLEIIVPDIVRDEFQRNKERVLAESSKSLQSTMRTLKNALPTFVDLEGHKELLDAIQRLDFSSLAGNIPSIVDQVEELIDHPDNIPIACDVFQKARAANRALDRQAPCHRDRNSMADAVLFEVYDELRAMPRRDHVAFAFATTNYKDFSEQNGDNRLPHRDLKYAFDQKSLYLVDIAKFVEENSPGFQDLFDLDEGLSPSFRSLTDLIEAEHLLQRQVWYNRHRALRSEIDQGTKTVVAEDDYSHSSYRFDHVLESLWKGALDAAKATEEEVGIENLGPWDDFDWGMINGKLSAIRWVLGDEWDMLDT